MLQSNSSGFGATREKIRHKSTGFETIASRTNAFEWQRHSGAFNNFIRVKNRRKFQIQGEQQLSFPLWKRKFVKQPSQKRCFHPLLGSIEKLDLAPSAKRNTFHGPEEKERLFLAEKQYTRVADLRRSKTKYTDYEESKKDYQNLRIANMNVDFYSKPEADKKLRNSTKKPTQLLKKKSKQFKETTKKGLKPPILENSLVSLITKYKFQNLRQSDISPEQFDDKWSKVQQLFPKQRLASPFYSEFKELKYYKKKEKMNKTMTKISSTAKTDSQKVTPRACPLTPWEIDSKELCSANDIF